MLIEDSNFKDGLSGKIVLVTGAGGGVGFETAKNLVWMGATVIIAEIDREKGSSAADAINSELKCSRAMFYHIDIADKKQLDEMSEYIIKNFGFLDVIINNATITPIGPVDEVPVEDWDHSYFVNLRAPVFLARKFIPFMKEKNTGTLVFVPSSGAAPYMGAYEVFKTSQVELANTIAAELEQTDINVYSIGPGLVKTGTAVEQIKKIADYMGVSPEELYAVNEKHILDVESAGVGFAVSVAMAKRYKGQEIGCIQALMDSGIIKREDAGAQKESPVPLDGEAVRAHLSNILSVYEEQYEGWLKRNLFERQWVMRDLKKVMKLSAEQVRDRLKHCEALAEQGAYGEISKDKDLFGMLKVYWEHQLKLLKGYEKDPAKLEENSKIICGWIEEIESVTGLLK